tara:strand:+ start:470 stop:973 length:504 start_codon:yes stop_codon:yes gene_type:complete
MSKVRRRGAGILPFAHFNNTIYFFFGRENMEGGHSAAGKWSDFGGSREKNETEYDTGLREGCEELSGIFGDNDTIDKLLKKTNITIKSNTYYTYLMEVEYDKNKEEELKNIYVKTLQENPDLIYKHNGLYEKDRGKWIELKHLNSFRPNMRRWYNRVLTKIIEYFNN